MRLAHWLIAAGALFLLAALDFLTGEEPSTGPLYILLAFVVARFSGPRLGVVYGICAAAFYVANDFAAPTPPVASRWFDWLSVVTAIVVGSLIQAPRSLPGLGGKDDEEDDDGPGGDDFAETKTQSPTNRISSHNFLVAHSQSYLYDRQLPFDAFMEQLMRCPVVSPGYVEHLVEQDATLRRPGAVADYLTRKHLMTSYQRQLFNAGHAAELSLGEYWILNQLGSGAAAIVLHARHKQLGLEYAIKVMAPGEEDVARRRRTELEMQASSELLHPNIVVVRETGEEKGVYFIVMEWVNGETLQSLVEKHGRLSFEETLDFALQAARGLALAHDLDLVHRDVKPGNLMVDARGVVKVVDMGLVGVEESSSDSSSRIGIFGTIEYMSPEQANNVSAVDHRSDIYGLGGTIFFMLTGKSLLRGRSNEEKLSNIVHGTGRRSVSKGLAGLPDAMIKLVQKMTAVDHRRRYDSMHQVVDDLQQIVDDSDIVVRRVDRVHLIVVEDDMVQRTVLSHFLKSSSNPFELTFAKSIANATDLLRRRSFDAAIVDLSLPDSSGVESVASIRAVNATLPIVVLTGSDDNRLGGECIRAGADDFYSKAQLTKSGLERRVLLSLSRRQSHAF